MGTNVLLVTGGKNHHEWLFASGILFLMLVVFLCQQYQPQMFLDNLTSSMQSVAAANTSTALLPSASSHYDTIGRATSSVHEAQVLTRGRTDGNISDIISLD